MQQKLSQPLVTVGVALYNHEAYIEQCLQSIITQTYSNIELIVIDDGSTDNSYQVAKNYVDSIEKPFKITLKTQENRGMCNTLNEIAKNAKGKYISFIGSDDYWMASKIEDQVEFLEKHPNLALVHSNSIKVNAQGDEIKKIDYSKKINQGSVYKALIQRKGGINTPSHLYRTKVYEEIGYYDPSFSFEDTDFWLRLSRQYKIGFINKFHTYYRWHGKNLSDNSNASIFCYDELIKIYTKNIPEQDLRQEAIRYIYKKCARKSLKAGKFIDAYKYLLKYFG